MTELTQANIAAFGDADEKIPITTPLSDQIDNGTGISEGESHIRLGSKIFAGNNENTHRTLTVMSDRN